jgi:hypothetical protein
MPEGYAELDEFLEQLGGLFLIVDALGHDGSSRVDKVGKGEWISISHIDRD